MAPEQVEATAQRIAASAALADGEVEGEVGPQSDALEAALAVEAVLREVSGDPRPTGASAAADADSDAAWFAVRPERLARLRPHQPGDPVPSWAAQGQPLMSVVRYFRSTGLSVEVLAANAFAGEPEAGSDAAVLAAVRSARGVR